MPLRCHKGILILLTIEFQHINMKLLENNQTHDGRFGVLYPISLYFYHFHRLLEGYLKTVLFYSNPS